MGPVSRPAGLLRSDPASAGVPPPAGAHRGPECPVAFRALLRPEADPATLAHLARLRAAQPQWPPSVVRAAPRRAPRRGRDGGVVRGRGLAAVELCSGPSPDVPCLAVHRGVVTCPRCRRSTPVVEARTGPRLPVCDCWPALCAHWPARVAPA